MRPTLRRLPPTNTDFDLASIIMGELTGSLLGRLVQSESCTRDKQCEQVAPTTESRRCSVGEASGAATAKYILCTILCRVPTPVLTKLIINKSEIKINKQRVVDILIRYTHKRQDKIWGWQLLERSWVLCMIIINTIVAELTPLNHWVWGPLSSCPPTFCNFPFDDL